VDSETSSHVRSGPSGEQAWKLNPVSPPSPSSRSYRYSPIPASRPPGGPYECGGERGQRLEVARAQWRRRGGEGPHGSPLLSLIRSAYPSYVSYVVRLPLSPVFPEPESARPRRPLTLRTLPDPDPDPYTATRSVAAPDPYIALLDEVCRHLSTRSATSPAPWKRTAAASCTASTVPFPTRMPGRRILNRVGFGLLRRY
jgi:hypothetical protein